jgi:CRISPR-associated protein Csh2
MGIENKEIKKIENRSELLFIYECKDINPNGDPLDENKPRIDEKTGINIVTDVRLKRTIRDYFLSIGKDVWIKEVVKENGELKTREERIEDEGIKTKKDVEKLLDRYIDLRLFGATIALAKKSKKSGEEPAEEGKPITSITWTGPVQFRFGRSLNRVGDALLIKGTTVMPSKEKKEQGTFTETWIIPYSLIAFYGIINENAAKDTKLTEDDVKLLLEGMWNGTKNLISRSKVGQMPRLLLRIIYKERNYHIGDLDKKIKLESSLNDEKIRNVKDFKLNIDKLIETIVANKDKIEKIEYCLDPDIILSKDIANELAKADIKVEKLSF